MFPVFPAFERSPLPTMDVASIVEAGFHPEMHCNDLLRMPADFVYSITFSRRDFEQRGLEMTVSGALEGSSLSTETGTSGLLPVLPLFKPLRSLTI